MGISAIALEFQGVRQGSKAHKQIIDYYNSMKPLPRGYKVKYTDNWCATFVSAMAGICGIGKAIYECGADKMYRKFVKKKWTLTYKNAKKDDIIFYDWQGTGNWYDHVGIIYRVTDKYIYVVEGNKSKKVGTRVINKDSLKSKKYAFGRIKE